MSVQFIFKTLIGTIALIVISALLIEIFNLQIVSLRLASLSKLAASQSAELFAQESYKNEGDRRSKNLDSIWSSSGVSDSGIPYASNLYIDGNLYGSSNAETIWANIYDTDTYAQFSADLGHNWYSLGIFDLALETRGGASASLPGWGEVDSAAMEAYNKAMMANTYYQNLYTPLNIGIPYLGEYHSDGFSSSENSNSVLDKAFRWNLAQLLSNCDPANIHQDASGEMYVSFSGFRCYVTEAEITKVTYEVFDISNDSDANRFEQLTGIDVDGGGSAGSLGLAVGDTTNLTTIHDEVGDERQNICVAFIEYSLPVSYRGITPIKRIFEWVWTNEVQGMEDETPVLEDQYWNDTPENLTGGGEGNSTLPTSGKLVYYIVR